MTVVPVFFSSDDRYAPYLATAVVSLISNASLKRDGEDYSYRIVIMNEDLSEENRKRLSALARDGFSIEFADMREKFALMSEKKSNRLRCDYFTMTIYARMFIPDMFPEHDKGIYLDSDITVPGDILDLYSTDLEGNLIGACVDESIQGVPPLLEYVERSVGVPHASYINSGILLMDMAKLREARIGDRFVELLNKWHFDSIAPDQDYINAMCSGRILYLDGTWDTMPADGTPERSDPKLVHYNLFSKPWNYDGIQYEEYFWKYASLSGYLEDIRREKASYSDEQKALDSENMKQLAVRGLQIVESGTTFREAFNTGKEARL